MYIGFNDNEREFTTQDILFALSRQVPLSVSQRETIGALRDWLREGRAQSASFSEIREAEDQFVPLEISPRTEPSTRNEGQVRREPVIKIEPPERNRTPARE
jgi:hypothetical protein